MKWYHYLRKVMYFERKAALSDWKGKTLELLKNLDLAFFGWSFVFVTPTRAFRDENQGS